MKAYICVDPSWALQIRYVPIPEVGPNQVLVRIVACGACHTDIHIQTGGLKGNPLMKEGHKPLILGHEGTFLFYL